MKNEEIIQEVIKYQTDTLEVLMNKAREDERNKWIKGFTWFAWWKGGIQYVGNGRTTLKKAIEIVDKNRVGL